MLEYPKHTSSILQANYNIKPNHDSESRGQEEAAGRIAATNERVIYR